jgi:hypothetical protein
MKFQNFKPMNEKHSRKGNKQRRIIIFIMHIDQVAQKNMEIIKCSFCRNLILIFLFSIWFSFEQGSFQFQLISLGLLKSFFSNVA